MFDFNERVLNPLISKTIGKIDAALKIDNITDTIENLLSVKQDAKLSFSQTSDGEIFKSGVITLALAAAVGLATIANAPSIAFFLLTIGASGVVGAVFKMIANSDTTQGTAKKIENRITTEVLNLARAYPQEVVKSPRFLKELKERFNVASAGETEFEQLRLTLPPTAAVGQRAQFSL